MKDRLRKFGRSRSTIIVAAIAAALVTFAPAALSRPSPERIRVAFQVVTPTVSVLATDGAAAEAGLDPGAFTVSRTGDTTSALTVNYTLSGTAANGSDYIMLAGSVAIAAGASSALVTVTPINDVVTEGDETAVLTLASGTGYLVGSPDVATVTIADNDPPAVSVVASDANASETGPDTGSFTVTRTGPTTNALTVNFTLGGTATNGSDYSLGNSVVIPVGSSSSVILVTPINDSAAEPSETVLLTIAANAAYAVGSPSAATVNIADNDLPTVNIDATDDAAAEAGTNTGTFTVTRSGDLTSALTVNYTIGGTASNGSDYTALSGSVVIPAAASSATIVVTPIDDAAVEVQETVVLTLAAGAGYTVGSSNSDTVNIADNDTTQPPTQPGDMPANKDECKKGGWEDFGVFKNQGDCVSWVATGGKNPPAG